MKKISFFFGAIKTYQKYASLGPLERFSILNVGSAESALLSRLKIGNRGTKWKQGKWAKYTSFKGMKYSQPLNLIKINALLPQFPCFYSMPLFAIFSQERRAANPTFSIKYLSTGPRDAYFWQILVACHKTKILFQITLTI